MIEIRSVVEIDRPPDQVFDMIADMSRNPEWQKGMRECVWTSDPPIGVGSTYEQVAAFLGRRIVTSFEVTEFDRPHRIRIESLVSTFPLDITRIVEPSGGGSRVEAIVKGEPGGLARVVSPLMTMMVKRSVTADYASLKDLLET